MWITLQNVFKNNFMETIKVAENQAVNGFFESIDEILCKQKKSTFGS